MPKNNNNNKNLNKKQKQRQVNRSTKNVARMAMVKGSGDYSTFMRKAVNTASDVAKELAPYLKPIVKNALVQTGGAIGSIAGGRFGYGSKGSAIGQDLGARLSKMIGSGDYTTNACRCNSLIGSDKSGGYAEFSNSKRSVRVQHREYLQDVFASTTFLIEQFEINPGLAFSFPYLASIAQNFEEFIFRGLVFEFVSTTSPYNSTSSMGSVITAMEYNAANPAFTSKPQMENSDFAISVRPDKNMMYGIECDVNAQNHYYVRASASTLPLTTTDLGAFYIASANMPASITGSIGELWVTYDVEFFRPRISPARYGYSHQSFNYTGAGSFYPTVLISSEVYGALTGLTYTAVSSGNGLYTYIYPNAIVGDVYMFTASWKCNVAQTGALTAVFTPLGFTQFPVFTSVSGLPNSSYTTTVSTTTLVLITAYFVVSAENPTMQLTTGGYTTATVSGLDIIVTDLGNGYAAGTL